MDRLGCRDIDKDGYSDPTSDWIAHPDGFADAFPEEASQWYDTDSDGYGDNMEYSMDKLGENHSEAIVVELLSVHQLLTDGVALIQMAMVGLTRQ